MENPAEMNVMCNVMDRTVSGVVEMGGPDAGIVIVTSLGTLGILGKVGCCFSN